MKILHLALSSQVTSLYLQNGDITYNLHKARTFNPFGATVWELSDGSRESPGTIIVRKSPIKRQTSFERRDGSLLASMCNRLVMTGGDFNWETKVYRQATPSIELVLGIACAVIQGCASLTVSFYVSF